MLHAISWSSYWTALLLTLIVYYSYAAWVNRPLFARRVTTPLRKEEVTDELFPMADQCGRELASYIEQLSFGKPSRPEFLSGIHRVIKKYPLLAGSAYEQSLSQLIRVMAKEKCALHLDEEETRQVWFV
jgi:hypothetical protein